MNYYNLARPKLGDRGGFDHPHLGGTTRADTGTTIWEEPQPLALALSRKKKEEADLQLEPEASETNSQTWRFLIESPDPKTTVAF
jgi:hypothetical protein